MNICIAVVFAIKITLIATANTDSLSWRLKLYMNVTKLKLCNIQSTFARELYLEKNRDSYNM